MCHTQDGGAGRGMYLTMKSGGRLAGGTKKDGYDLVVEVPHYVCAASFQPVPALDFLV